MKPRVSVLMSVYNGERFLREAVESILGQTFADFEFIIIDDGSTDGTRDILAAYAASDARVVLVRNERNIGLAYSLNEGLKLALGEYVARMDADDISLRNRLAVQVRFMENHAHVGVCGTAMRTFGGGRTRVIRPPLHDSMIRCHMLFGSPFVHPSVVIRRGAFVRAGLFYDPSLKRTQDYELWTRAASHFALANVPQALLLYRKHSQQVTRRFRRERRAVARRIWLMQLHKMGIGPTASEMEIHTFVSTLGPQPTRELLARAEAWLRHLEAVNAESKCYDHTSFREVLGQRWLALAWASTGLGLESWRAFWGSPLSRSSRLHGKQLLKYAIKCGFKLKLRG